MNYFIHYRDGHPPNFITKASIGMCAGAIGAFVGTPAEISLIRMTADGRLVRQMYSCAILRIWITIVRLLYHGQKMNSNYRNLILKIVFWDGMDDL